MSETRDATNGNTVSGTRRFQKQMEDALGRRVTKGKPGRPGRMGEG